MLTITLSDGCKVTVPKVQVAERASCFQPLSETSGEEVRFDATTGRHRSTLLEYFGSGVIGARDIEDRDTLRDDLEAWAIPVEAWPSDLRLQAAQDQREADLETSVAYQKDWVPAAVTDCIEVVRRSAEFRIHINLKPGAGKFDVTAEEEDYTEVTINTEAFETIQSQLKQSLHMLVSGTQSCGAIRISPCKRRRTHPWTAGIRKLFTDAKLSRDNAVNLRLCDMDQRLARLEAHLKLETPAIELD